MPVAGSKTPVKTEVGAAAAAGNNDGSPTGGGSRKRPLGGANANPGGPPHWQQFYSFNATAPQITIPDTRIHLSRPLSRYSSAASVRTPFNLHYIRRRLLFFYIQWNPIARPTFQNPKLTFR